MAVYAAAERTHPVLSSLSPPCANLNTVLHPKASCYFLRNLSFAFTPCLLLLICWGFCGIIYMCSVRKRIHRTVWCLRFISLVKNDFLDNLGSSLMPDTSRNSSSNEGIVGFTVFIMSFAFECSFDGRGYMCVHI